MDTSATGASHEADFAARALEAGLHCALEQDGEIVLGGDRFYDIGRTGCADSPTALVGRVLGLMEIGETLEVRAEDAAVKADLPAWVRMAGHELLATEGDRFLIRRAA